MTAEVRTSANATSELVTRTMTPIELIRSYWSEVWNERQVDQIRDICRDPIVRHDPACVNPLSHDDQIVRVRQQSDKAHPYFTHEVLLGDDRFVCSVWNMFTRKGEPVQLSGIEVFEAAEGRFTDCWNSSYSLGFWGRLRSEQDPLQARPIADDTAGGEIVRGRDPLELVRQFFEALTRADRERLQTVVADRLTRYQPGRCDVLSRDDLLTDELADCAEGAPTVSFDALFGERDYVCAVWNLSLSRDASVIRSGIDVFRHTGGRLVEWWTPPRTKGAWGREGDPGVASELPPPALLTTVADIDADWLQAVFRHAGVDVPRIAFASAKPIGHGNVSETVRVSLGYNQPVTNEPTSVVCKFNSNYPAIQAQAAIFSPYRTEVCAYRHFGAEPPLRIAHAYHLACSDDGLLVNMVLQDLGAFCEPGNQLTGCSIADAVEVTHELANLHARYWNAPGLKDLAWIAANAPETSYADHYLRGLEVYEQRYAALLGDDMEVIRAFAPLVHAWRGREPADITLIHADPRVDNIMFDRRDGAVKAYLIDWQMTSWGSAARDLAYFLTGSLTIDDRRACEHALVAQHARAISKVDPAYTEAVALERYRTEAVSGLFATVGAASVMPDTPHNRDLLTTLAARNVSAVRDWRTLEALSRY